MERQKINDLRYEEDRLRIRLNHPVTQPLNLLLSWCRTIQDRVDFEQDDFFKPEFMGFPKPTDDGVKFFTSVLTKFLEDSYAFASGPGEALQLGLYVFANEAAPAWPQVCTCVKNVH
jgi:hypothetical protein